MTFATPVLPADAVSAVATRLEYLDGYPVAGGHTPPLGRPLTDGLDRPNRLVAGNKRKPAGELARVLLMVGPAQPAGRATRTSASSSPTAGTTNSRTTRSRGTSKTNARTTAPSHIPAHDEVAD